MLHVPFIFCNIFQQLSNDVLLKLYKQMVTLTIVDDNLYKTQRMVKFMAQNWHVVTELLKLILLTNYERSSVRIERCLKKMPSLLLVFSSFPSPSFFWRQLCHCKKVQHIVIVYPSIKPLLANYET